MIERFHQYTCDGCGEVEQYPFPDATLKEVRSFMREYGWRSYGRLDYCKHCVKNGNAKRRETDMSH